MRGKNSYVSQWLSLFFIFCMIAIVMIGIVQSMKLWGKEKKEVDFELEGKIETFDSEEILDLPEEILDLPEELKELLEKNPDAKEFVLNYPLKKNQSFEIDLTEYENRETVPLFFQWDERWGYTP